MLEQGHARWNPLSVGSLVALVSSWSGCAVCELPRPSVVETLALASGEVDLGEADLEDLRRDLRWLVGESRESFRGSPLRPRAERAP